MSAKNASISRKRVKAISKINNDRLSNKALLKMINRHTINKKLTSISERLGKRTIFTNSELDKAIELFGLSIDDLKELAKRRLIKNYADMNKDKLYCVLVKTEKSPLEDSYMKYLKNDFRSDLNQRINHVLLLMTKLELDNKVTNTERLNIYEELKELKEKYVGTRNKNFRMQVVERIVKITNDLYNKQKQHTRLLRDQAYLGLRDLKYLFEEDNNNYESILVRSSLDGRFEEYEISGSRQVLSLREYLTMIYLPLKKLIDEKQKSTKFEHKVQLRMVAIFTKVNNELERQVQYIDSDSLKLRNGDNTEKFIKVMYDSVLKNFEQKENSLRGSNVVFSGIDLTLVQFVKLKLKRGGSYIPTPEWISVKKSIINPKNSKDECCFAYSKVASIHNEEIDNHPERISKLTPFVNNYYWTDMNFPSEQKIEIRLKKIMMYHLIFCLHILQRKK